MPKALANQSSLPGAVNLLQELTPYDLRNLVAHLVEAQNLDALGGLLTLETADSRNAWYGARAGADELAAYVLDVRAAISAVQETPMKAETESALAPRLGDQYRYALLLTSVNSLASTVPPSLLTAMRLNHLVTTPDALSYARRATDAIERAEALVQLLPALDESERADTIDEIMREIEAPDVALLEQQKFLASLVPYVNGVERTRIVNEIINRLEDADNGGRDDVWRFVDPVFAVKCSLTPVQAERLFELASRSSNELVREDLLPAIGATADGELLDRVLAAAREISFSRRRASVLMELAPRLSQEERVKALREATEAALEWKSPDQLGKLLEVCPEIEQSRVLQATIEAAWNADDAAESSVALLKASFYIQDLNERDRVINRALEAVRVLESRPPFSSRLVSLVRLGERLPPPAKARLWPLVLAAARATRMGDERVAALAQLIDYASEPDKETTLTEAFKVFEEIGPILQGSALKKLAPRLPPSLLHEAFRIIQAIRDDDNQRTSLTALAPYLLSSPTDPEVAEVVAAARAVDYVPIGRDILVALATQLTGTQRASVLDALVDLAVEHGSVSKDLAILAPNLNYTKTVEVRPVWQRAVRIAGEIGDAAERAWALTALGSNVGPDAPAGVSTTACGTREVLNEALRAAREIEADRLADRAIALVTVGRHLPEAERSQAFKEASNAAWFLIRKHREARRQLGDIAQGMPVDALAIVAAEIGLDKSAPIAKVVVEFSRRKPDYYSESKAYALATVAKCYREPTRSKLLREAVVAARKKSLKDTLVALAPFLQVSDRSVALSDALPEARQHDGYTLWSSIAEGLASLPTVTAYQVLRNPPAGLTTLPRKNLLTEITHMAPIIFALGGRPAIADIAESIKQSARWWP